MSNLQKFNSTLEDFDKEVGKLKEVSGAYQKLESLTAKYDAIIKQFEVNSNTLDKIIELQKAQQEKIAKTLSDIEKANKQSEIELSKLINTNHKDFESKISASIEVIRKENNEFYKELESTIKIKLDDNKSQIKQLIESERSQIKQIFEIEFAKNTRELRQVIEAETNKQTQIILENQKVIKLSVWIVGSISIILSAIAVFKLFSNK